MMNAGKVFHRGISAEASLEKSFSLIEHVAELVIILCFRLKLQLVSTKRGPGRDKG